MIPRERLEHLICATKLAKGRETMGMVVTANGLRLTTILGHLINRNTIESIYVQQ